MLAERGFLDADGLQGRQWFKHLVSAFLFLDYLKLILYFAKLQILHKTN
jgi:hypothetical protein